MLMQETNQPEMRVYNVRHELINTEHEDGHRYGDEKLGPFGKLLVAIPGIEVVRVQPYRFFISKAAMFEWSEIEPEIARLVGTFKDHQDLIASGLGGENADSPAAGELSEP